MMCVRFDLWKFYSRYLDGELDRGAVASVESHLLDCNDCRARVARLRDGQRLARQLPLLKPHEDGWEALAAALEREAVEPVTPGRPNGAAAWQRTLTSPYFATAILGLALMVLSAALLWDKQKPAPREVTGPVGTYNAGTYNVGTFNGSGFRPVLISEIDKNTASHVVAEGYVTEVKLKGVGGDYMFKLVDDVGQAEPFIICEIITPINLEPPVVGSRVRVYGVSRFDAEEGRRWHEVHPVLNIEMVRP